MLRLLGFDLVNFRCLKFFLHLCKWKKMQQVVLKFFFFHLSGQCASQAQLTQLILGFRLELMLISYLKSRLLHLYSGLFKASSIWTRSKKAHFESEQTCFKSNPTYIFVTTSIRPNDYFPPKLGTWKLWFNEIFRIPSLKILLSPVL